MNRSKVVVIRDTTGADVTLESYDLIYNEEPGYEMYGWANSDRNYIAAGVTFREAFIDLCNYSLIEDLKTGTVVLTLNEWVREAAKITRSDELTTDGVILVKFVEVNGQKFVTIQKDMDSNDIRYFPYLTKEYAIKALWTVLDWDDLTYYSVELHTM